MPGLRYRLVDQDGNDLGNAEYLPPPVKAGDTIYVNGNQPHHVTAVLNVERAGEFVDDATHTVLQITPA